MSALPPMPTHTPQVRRLLASIAIMTLAIAFMLGMVVGRLLSPSGGGEPPKGAIDFAAAPAVEIGLPAGAKVVDAQIGPDRITLTTVTPEGETAILTTPMSGLERPVRLVYRALE